MDRRQIATASVLELSKPSPSKPSRFIPESYRKTKSSSVIPRSDVWTSAPFKRIIHEAIDRSVYLELDVENLPQEYVYIRLFNPLIDPFSQDFMPILVLYCNDIYQNMPEKMAEPLDSLLRKRREATGFPLR